MGMAVTKYSEKILPNCHLFNSDNSKTCPGLASHEICGTAP